MSDILSEIFRFRLCYRINFLSCSPMDEIDHSSWIISNYYFLNSRSEKMDKWMTKQPNSQFSHSRIIRITRCYSSTSSNPKNPIRLVHPPSFFNPGFRPSRNTIHGRTLVQFWKTRAGSRKWSECIPMKYQASEIVRVFWNCTNVRHYRLDHPFLCECGRILRWDEIYSKDHFCRARRVSQFPILRCESKISKHRPVSRWKIFNVVESKNHCVLSSKGWQGA